MKGKFIEIQDLKLNLQLFRCFGWLITIIHLEFDRDSTIKLEKRVLSYLQEYCTKSLTTITFMGCESGSLNNLTKPFPRMENVLVSDSMMAIIRMLKRTGLNDFFKK